MLESTNALISSLIAVLRELNRCRQLLDAGSLPEAEEEELGPFIDQLNEALADLSSAYADRQSENPSLLTIEALIAKIAAESPSSGA